MAWLYHSLSSLAIWARITSGVLFCPKRHRIHGLGQQHGTWSRGHNVSLDVVEIRDNLVGQLLEFAMPLLFEM
jgi:hypothetical protein